MHITVVYSNDIVHGGGWGEVIGAFLCMMSVELFGRTWYYQRNRFCEVQVDDLFSFFHLYYLNEQLLQSCPYDLCFCAFISALFLFYFYQSILYLRQIKVFL